MTSIQQLVDLGFLDAPALAHQSALLKSVTPRVYQPGDTLFMEGEAGESIYLINQGLIKMLTHLPNGRTRILRLHRRGAIVGLNGLLGKAHEHSALAVDEVHVLLIPLAEILPWKEQQPELYARLMETWYQYLNYADTWITEFSTGSVKGRVARLINFLARFDTDTGPRIVELLTTEEMADILGVTPESVSRVVAELKREAILKPIENNAESLFTFDRDVLTEMALS